MIAQYNEKETHGPYRTGETVPSNNQSTNIKQISFVIRITKLWFNKKTQR